jgi:chromosome partitioning protein
MAADGPAAAAFPASGGMMPPCDARATPATPGEPRKVVDMRTVAIINQKGGCGKTTSSINLAACLARLGQKTLLVDMDPQGHCGTGLAVPEDQVERTIYDAMLDPSDTKDGRVPKISDLVWQIASDFDLAPSNIRLSAFEQVFAGRPGREDRLARVLDAVKDQYKWCVIDCPPSVGLITFNALKACDEVIVPVETGYFSLHGLTKMMETLEMLRERAGKEVVIRVLPTLYDTRTKLAREVLSELRAKFKDYLMTSTVNFNTKLKEAASFGQPITEYDPGSRGYKDFVALARELMGARPAEVEVSPDKMTRPQELVQRARQLQQFAAGYTFGKNASPTIPQPQAQLAAQAQPTAQPVPTSAPAVAAPAYASAAGGPTVSPSRVPSPAAVAYAAPSGARPATPAPGLRLAGSQATAAAGAFAAPTTFATVAHQQASAQQAAAQQYAAARTTDQKLADFYGVRQTHDGVVFSARFEQARQVLIAGDFNNWRPASTPMLHSPGTGWTMRLPLEPGRYRYRFVVDGKWMTDPHNTTVEANQFGELDNIVEVA